MLALRPPALRGWREVWLRPLLPPLEPGHGHRGRPVHHRRRVRHLVLHAPREEDAEAGPSKSGTEHLPLPPGFAGLWLLCHRPGAVHQVLPPIPREAGESPEEQGHGDCVEGGPVLHLAVREAPEVHHEERLHTGRNHGHLFLHVRKDCRLPHDAKCSQIWCLGHPRFHYPLHRFRHHHIGDGPRGLLHRAGLLPRGLSRDAGGQLHRRGLPHSAALHERLWHVRRHHAAVLHRGGGDGGQLLRAQPPPLARPLPKGLRLGGGRQ
mmetsp:Transcript_76362/g.227579  ORF Transcript_76362/g.227579 Transcript_76362/m.227579 type:complete len:265 (+) Transcript_76362:448-1242(+)